jgi:phage repressor protein C with HTH and peptisase S24 domain/DNA-binding XRE family transcriptional regulator
MVKTNHNIKEIRQLYNLTQQEFAAALGITRELVNKMEKGRSGVSKATSALLREFMQERKSENNSHISDEVEFFGIPRSKTSVPYHLQRRAQKNEASPFLVPLVGIKAQAGYIKGYEQVDYLDTLDKYSLPPGVNPTGAVWSYFEVDGESMEPSLFSGDIILASMLPYEDWNEVKNFSVYIILTHDRLLVKRVYRKNEKEWILISDNEESNPQVALNLSDVKQVWTFRRQIRSRVPQPKEFMIQA